MVVTYSIVSYGSSNFFSVFLILNKAIAICHALAAFDCDQDDQTSQTSATFKNEKLRGQSQSKNKMW